MVRKDEEKEKEKKKGKEFQAHGLIGSPRVPEEHPERVVPAFVHGRVLAWRHQLSVVEPMDDHGSSSLDQS